MCLVSRGSYGHRRAQRDPGKFGTIPGAAGSLKPAELRSADAIHLSTALQFGEELAAIVTYDARMAHAAESLGCSVAAPK